MRNNIFNILILISAIFVLSESTLAQSRVIFQVNLKQQMKDSVFVPSEHSIVITGNQTPFSKTRTIKMQDKAPIDSIFTAEVSFPYSSMDKTLEYNYVIKRKNGDLEEFRPRLLPLKRSARRILNVTFFNDYAL